MRPISSASRSVEGNPSAIRKQQTAHRQSEDGDDHTNNKSTRTLPAMLSAATPSTLGVRRDPEKARLMRKAGEKNEKKVSSVAQRVERKKKGMALRNAPLVRGKQQRGEGKQSALGKEKAAATRLE
jgi:hypothetical protein